MIRLYSDDFGYSAKTDKGIIRLIRGGKLFGASVLSTMASSQSLAKLSLILNRKNGFILGLHLNLIEGKPARPYKKIKSLVDKKGHFLPLLFFSLKLLLGKINKVHVRSEIESQLTKLLKSGLSVKMLDSHQHTHAFSPVAEVVVDLSRKYNIPYIRSFGTIKTYSLKARLTYAILKALAFLSYFVTYKKIGMPASWEVNQEFDWTVMSWEGDSFDASTINNSRSAFVIHPYLTYDTNRSYLKYIK